MKAKLETIEKVKEAAADVPKHLRRKKLVGRGRSEME